MGDGPGKGVDQNVPALLKFAPKGAFPTCTWGMGQQVPPKGFPIQEVMLGIQSLSETLEESPFQ